MNYIDWMCLPFYLDVQYIVKNVTCIIASPPLLWDNLTWRHLLIHWFKERVTFNWLIYFLTGMCFCFRFIFKVLYFRINARWSHRTYFYFFLSLSSILNVFFDRIHPKEAGISVLLWILLTLFDYFDKNLTIVQCLYIWIQFVIHLQEHVGYNGEILKKIHLFRLECDPINQHGISGSIRTMRPVPWADT